MSGIAGTTRAFALQQPVTVSAAGWELSKNHESRAGTLKVSRDAQVGRREEVSERPKRTPTLKWTREHSCSSLSLSLSPPFFLSPTLMPPRCNVALLHVCAARGGLGARGFEPPECGRPGAAGAAQRARPPAAGRLSCLLSLVSKIHGVCLD